MPTGPQTTAASLPTRPRAVDNLRRSRRVDAAEGLLRAAATLVVSSPAGTSLTADITDASTRADTGIAAQQGTLAHWPAGGVWTRPKRTTITGCVVAMPGDLVVEAGHVLRSPVRVEIEAGKLTEVLGDSADADIVRSQLEHLDDDRAYDIAEIGWGMSLTRPAVGSRPTGTDLLAPGRGASESGRVNVRAGARSETDLGVTLSLAATSCRLDDLDVVADGALTGTLAPDVYERTAGA